MHAVPLAPPPWPWPCLPYPASVPDGQSSSTMRKITANTASKTRLLDDILGTFECSGKLTISFSVSHCVFFSNFFEFSTKLFKCVVLVMLMKSQQDKNYTDAASIKVTWFYTNDFPFFLPQLWMHGQTDRRTGWQTAWQQIGLSKGGWGKFCRKLLQIQQC